MVVCQIWDHTFELLDAKVGQVDQTENSVEGAFLTEAARNPKATREKTCQASQPPPLGIPRRQGT